jgi:hypothetical protein
MEPIDNKTNEPRSAVTCVSQGRRRRQRGSEAIEFALWMFLTMPPLVWMFITGMNFVRYIKANDVTRAAAMLYTKGLDMTDLGTQQVLERVASGLDLEAVSAGVRVTNVGNGLLVFTKVEMVSSSCGCINAGKYVMSQRIYVGNRSLQLRGSTVESFIGPAPSSGWNSSTGVVSNITTNATAVASSEFTTLWGSALTAGQYVYVVESFFKPVSSMGSGDFDANGVSTRIFM